MIPSPVNAPSAPRALTFGALEEPISKQLAGFISAEDGEELDRHSDAISRCHLFGFIPDAQTDRAREKLMELCKSAIRLEAPRKALRKEAEALALASPPWLARGVNEAPLFRPSTFQPR